MYSEIYEPNGMFHTPESIMEITDWIMGLNGGERIAAMTASYMMYNYFCNLLQEMEKDLFEGIE